MVGDVDMDVLFFRFELIECELIGAEKMAGVYAKISPAKKLSPAKNKSM